MRKTILFLAVMIIFTLFSLSAFGQTLRATSFEIKESEMSMYYGGKLYITVNGKKRKIGEEAYDVWIINDGKEVVYSARDGAGGFENEGQSLYLHDVKTNKNRKIMSEYFIIVGVKEVKLSNGATALLVRMSDGGLGGSYFSVVDPKRGEVLFQGLAELSELNGDTIKLLFYKQDDWEAILDERGEKDYKHEDVFPLPTKVKSYKSESYDLKEVLKNKVIYNKTNEELGREYERKYSNLSIYLWRPNDTSPKGEEYFLMAVSREFPKTISPLRVSLESLFAGATKYERETGWESAVFGMKFEGVVLKDGVATIKFSQPTEKKKMLSIAPKMFLEAVEKTAKQFATVKKVEICEVGGTTFAFDVTPQIPKCQ